MLERYETWVAQYRSAWRFRRAGIIGAWTIGIIGWLVVCLIPSQYESTARVYVDTNTLLRPLLEGMTVSQNTGSQVDLVRRALLSRPQLERVIDSTELHTRISSDRGRESAINDLAKDIQIRVDPSVPADREPSDFQIVYADGNPTVAYHVVDSVLQSFVTQSVGAARSDSDVAEKFLRTQIAGYEALLTQAETRLAAFKENNIGSMPDDRGGYFQRLQAQMGALDQLRSSLSVAQSKRDQLRAKLLGGPSANDASALGVAASSVDARLRQEQARLEEMLLRFTDKHPDVIALRETIGRLEAQRAQEIDQLRNNKRDLGTPRAGTSLVAENLQIALNQAELEVTSLQAQLADARRSVAELRESVNTTPKVEAELARLNRDYEVTKTEYDRLAQRLESAKLSDAAGRVNDVKFRILEPPTRALIPTKPHRNLLLLAVLAAALAGGAAIAWALAQLKPVFVHPRELRRFKNLAVFGVIGEVISDATLAARRRAVRGVLITMTGLVIGTGLLVLLYPSLESGVRAAWSNRGAWTHGLR
jgi:polysaccharide chain length determinant protein (PEP-CTERM system associated)